MSYRSVGSPVMSFLSRLPARHVDSFSGYVEMLASIIQSGNSTGQRVRNVLMAPSSSPSWALGAMIQLHASCYVTLSRSTLTGGLQRSARCIIVIVFNFMAYLSYIDTAYIGRERERDSKLLIYSKCRFAGEFFQ